MAATPARPASGAIVGFGLLTCFHRAPTLSHCSTNVTFPVANERCPTAQISSADTPEMSPRLFDPEPRLSLGTTDHPGTHVGVGVSVSMRYSGGKLLYEYGCV